MELFGKTDSESLRIAAEACFTHERHGFSARLANWPDSRFTDDRTGEDSFNWAWCHGAPGIALARLRAWQITEDERLLAEAITALDSTVRHVRAVLRGDGADFCLCHGLAGNATVALTGSRVLGDRWPDGLSLAEDVAAYGIERYQLGGGRWPLASLQHRHPGLMTGLAGIVHFLLDVAGERVFPVLLPPAGSASLENPRDGPELAVAGTAPVENRKKGTPG